MTEEMVQQEMLLDHVRKDAPACCASATHRPGGVLAATAGLMSGRRPNDRGRKRHLVCNRQQEYP